MATQETVKWTIEADHFMACSCDYGCPCQFQARPTQGFCAGVLAYRINRGNYADISLNGLGLGVAVRWPGAIHEGNGTVAVFIDERADQRQREALLKIVSGEAGGLPFEILAGTFSKVLDPLFVPVQFDLQGRNSSVRIGDAASMAFEPIKNPVTGEPEDIRLDHPTSFIFKDGEAVSAKECRVSAGELNFSYPDKAGYVARVQYGN